MMMIPSDQQIVDAEFETLGPRKDRAATPERSAPQSQREGLGVFTETKTQRARSEPMPLPLFAAIATLAACVSFYVAGGHVLFSSAPTPPTTLQTAQNPSTTGPIVLEQVSTRIDTSGSRAVIVIRATIANQSSTEATVPPVTIMFDRPDGSGAITHTINRGERLAGGELMAFTSRIPAGEYAGIEPRVSLAPAR